MFSLDYKQATILGLRTLIPDVESILGVKGIAESRHEEEVSAASVQAPDGDLPILKFGAKNIPPDVLNLPLRPSIDC
jgi:hypothetical protein